MSKTQELLQRMDDAWNSDEYCSDYFLGAIHALEAVPEVYHNDVLHALFKESEKAQESEQPEDYAVVRMFDSDEFHIGDEVTDGMNKVVICGKDGFNVFRVFGGSTYAFDQNSAENWHRTGRNFPAIPAILDALKR